VEAWKVVVVGGLGVLGVGKEISDLEVVTCGG
jgi:hypothetical protein